MEERYRLVEELKAELKEKLRGIVANESEYRSLVRKLIVQGLLRMMEKNVAIEASGAHRGMIQQTLKDCEQDFSKIMRNETGKEMVVSLSLSEYCLEEKHKNIIGGVFLRSNDGLIVCDNSLDARVDLIFEHLLPEIRRMLFPPKKN